MQAGRGPFFLQHDFAFVQVADLKAYRVCRALPILPDDEGRLVVQNYIVALALERVSVQLAHRFGRVPLQDVLDLVDGSQHIILRSGRVRRGHASRTAGLATSINTENKGSGCLLLMRPVLEHEILSLSD